MNYLKLHLIAMLAIASVSHAQVGSESLSAEVDAEIDRMYSAPTIQSAQPQAVQTVIVAPRAAVQKQPVTLVEASPLSTSNAESIRKNRQEEEMKTETRIVEKLELSSMEDEKKRAQILFGDKFDALNNKEQVAAPAVAESAVPVVAPSSNVQAQPIIIQSQDSLTRADVAQEVRAALDEDKATENDEASTNLFDKKYFSAQAGVPQYADSQAIRGNYSAGIGVGTQNDYLQVEGGFIYSNYNLDALYCLNQFGCGNGFSQFGFAPFIMNQYQTYLSAKFQIMSGSIRPNLGGLLSYSHRTYETNAFTILGPAGTRTGSSGAVDLGITAGVDIALNQRFSLGADLKYMFNMSTNINGNTVNGAAVPERLNYYLLGVAAKMAF